MCTHCTHCAREHTHIRINAQLCVLAVAAAVAAVAAVAQNNKLVCCEQFILASPSSNTTESHRKIAYGCRMHSIELNSLIHASNHFYLYMHRRQRTMSTTHQRFAYTICWRVKCYDRCAISSLICSWRDNWYQFRWPTGCFCDVFNNCALLSSDTSPFVQRNRAHVKMQAAPFETHAHTNTREKHENKKN